MSEHRRLQARSIAIVRNEAETGELTVERTAVPYPPVWTTSRGAAADEFDSDAADPQTYMASATVADELSVVGADRLCWCDRPSEYKPPPLPPPHLQSPVDVEAIVT